MFNLLPKAEKEAIRREYRLRLTVVALSLSLLTALVAVALLLPSYFLSSQKEEAAERRVEHLEKSVAQKSAAESDQALLDTASRLRILRSAPPSVYFHEALLRLVKEKGGRISLLNITLGHGENGTWRADIAGIARDRSALLAYAKMLERSGLFKEVEVPISNFAGDADIKFSLRASGAL